MEVKEEMKMCVAELYNMNIHNQQHKKLGGIRP